MVKLGQKRKTRKTGIKKHFSIKITPLDLMFSRYVRAKAEYTCEYCGQKPNPKGLHCSHYIGRRYRNTRWLEANVSCLCFSCHNLMHDFPSVHRDFFVKRIGSERLEKLEILARSGNKLDLVAIKADLERKLERIK